VRDHFVQLYSGDDYLIEEVSTYLRAGLAAGETCIAVATADHRRGLARRLGRDAERVTLLDAAEALARIDGGAGLLRAGFHATIGRDVEQGCAGGPGVRAFGEIVALLAADGRNDDALDLEACWTGLMSRLPLELLCAYPLGVFERSGGGDALKSVCDAHSHVLPIEGVVHAASPPVHASAGGARHARAHGADLDGARGRSTQHGIPRHVLVVDDDPNMAETLGRWLRNAGHRVQIASDGASAIAEVVRSRPEIVLLDIAMPKIDGYEVARRLRALPALHSCVLVALTGMAEPGDVERAKHAGFDHHMAKPPDLRRLAALLKSGL
jgi:CheY-like chemotaxis protein